MSKVCTACAAENREEARFCQACGDPFAERCHVCGAEREAGARFCDSCGAPAVAGGAPELRKTVTVLFADLVGSTSLGERLDPESVRRVMTRFYETSRAAVADHDGRVVKFTGDGVMAVFGIPVVREDDALRAVRTGAALADALGRLNVELERDWGVSLQVRTGVNTGEVIVGGADGDIVGDPVNLAARLEQAAQAGEVLLGEQTQRLVRHDVSLEPVAPLELKGKAEPVAAFRLLAAEPPAEEVAPVDVPLVGRGGELARLRAAFYAAVADRCCKLVTVIGSPGLGKTRLALELARSVGGEARVLEGRCEASDAGITFAPIAEVLRAAAGVGEGDDAASAREKLAGLLPEGPDCEQVVERALGVLGAVPAASTEETFWAVRRVLETLAHGVPLVVVLDDVHWGQPTFLDLVEHLVEWTRDAPLLLVALARPELRELREALASGRRAAEVIELDPLDASASRTLVDELLGQVDLPESLTERILAATEGNPLFVGETVRMLVDDGVLGREGDSWVVCGEGEDVEVPPTIHALIAARLERLHDDERAIVERASVIGKQFYRGAVAELSPPPVRLGIDGHLATLRRKELVEPEGTYWIDEPVFRFHHVLIRDAAYRSVLKEARAELHERFADWLESKAGALIGEHEEVVAFHLEQAHEYRRQLGPLDDRGRALGRRAAERLGSAGRRALARDDLPAARNLLQRALDRLDDAAPERAGLLVDLAEALLSAGDTHSAEPVVRALQGAAGDERLRALAAVYAAQLAYLTDSSRLHETVEALAGLAEQLAELGDEAGVAKAMHVQAAAFAQLGEVGAVEAALDRALAAARSADDARRVSAVLAGAPLAALWGPSPVVRASGRCLDVVRLLRMTPGNRHLEAAALSCQAVLEAMRGRPAAARSMLDGCRTTFEELGLGLQLLETDVHAGVIELLDGEPAAAEAPLRAAYEGFDALGAATGTERAAALLARTLLDQGRDDEADELTRISEERGGEDLKATIAWCGVRAQVLARRGEHGEAERLARRGAQMAAQTDALTDHADARMALAVVLRADGREEEAVSEAQRALELYRGKENEAGAGRAQRFAGAESKAPAGTGEGPALARPPGTDLRVGDAASRSARQALARFEGLRRTPSASSGAGAVPARWPRPATTRQLVERFVAACDARDIEGLRALIADDASIVDRRPRGWGEQTGPGFFLDLVRRGFELAPDVTVQSHPLALGRRAIAGYVTVRGHLADGGGEFELRNAGIVLVDDGLVTYWEIVGDDRDAALRRYEELGADCAFERLDARQCRLVNARDWDAYPGCFETDTELVDRRPMSWEPLRGPGAGVDFYRSWVDLVPDLELSVETIAGDDEVSVVRAAGHGHSSEGCGEMEYAVLRVQQLVDGRYGRLEIFDPDDVSAALARADERRHGPHAAAVARELLERFVDAFNDRAWDDVMATMTPDVRIIDRRLLAWEVMSGPDAFITMAHGFLELSEDLRVEAEIVIGGARGSIARQRYRGHLAHGGGEAEIEMLILNVRDGHGRTELIEIFDGADATAALARFEEIGAATEPERAYTRLCRAWSEVDWEAFADAVADDFRYLEHRTMGWDIEGKDDFVDMFRTWHELVSWSELRFETLAGDDTHVALIFGGVGVATAELGGGRLEYPVLQVATIRDGRIARAEQFDPEDEAAALERLETLRRQGAPGPRGGADASRSIGRAVMERYVAAYTNRDSDAHRDLFTPDVKFIDHRPVSWEEFEGYDAWHEIATGTLELASDMHVEVEVLAGGAGGYLARHAYRGHFVHGGGPVELAALIVGPIDEQGRITRVEIFAPDDTDAAWRRFEDVGAATEPERVFARGCRLVHARRFEDLAGCFSDAFEMPDNRVLAWEPHRGGRDEARLYGSWVEMVPDIELSFETLAGGDAHLVVRHEMRGHAADGGGAIEYAALVVAALRDGRWVCAQVFDDADEAGALSLYEAWSREPESAGTIGVAPRRSLARDWIEAYVAAYNARDWRTLEELFAPDLRIVDRRVIGWGELEGCDAWLEVIRGYLDLAPDMRCSSAILAATDHASVARFLYRAHRVEGGGLVEIEVVVVARFGNARNAYVEVYDGADSAAALSRFEEVGVATEPERVYSRIVRNVNARDWVGLLDCYTQDYEGIDHRPVGWEPQRGPESLVVLFRSWVDVVPDLEVWFELIEGDENRIATRFNARGHAADGGGEIEVATTISALIRDGRMARADIFGADEASALELLAEWQDATNVAARPEVLENDATAEGLDRVEDRRAARGVPATPRRHFDRYIALTNAHDWDALGELVAADVRFVDHRPVGWGEVHGRDAFIEVNRGRLALSPDFEVDGCLLILGKEASLARLLYRGHGERGGEWEEEFLSLATFDDGRATHGELFSADALSAAFVRFAEIGVATDPERAYARICGAFNAADWDALANCVADDFEYVERRPVGWDVRDKDGFLEIFRSWRDVVTSPELRLETLGGDERNAALRVTGHATAKDDFGGGTMEYPVIAVVSTYAGRVILTEHFGPDQEDAALARVAELACG